MVITRLALTVAAVGSLVSKVHANIMTFDTLAVGTQYGTPTNSPGDLVHTENGIQLRVQTFLFVGTGSIFNFADVRNNAALFPTNYLNVNNINLNFSFAGLTFTPTRVTFEYIDQGGSENFSVNGAALYRGELAAAPTTWGSVTLAVGPATPIPGGSKRTVTLTGPVTQFTVGGQEFGIDSINAERPCGPDYNNDGRISVQDVFDFLSAWFAGMP